jgi:alpha-glutamyl/putrescinyl thymine pyrophosphorylase clade 1
MNIDITSSIHGLKPTPAWDTFWRFAAERQAVFFRKAVGTTPLTSDPILLDWKFTNPYRATDRTSQYGIHVIYTGDPAPTEVVFRTLLFKLFNRIGTWELLENAFGEVRADDFSVARYDAVLTEAKARGVTLYSAAYRMGQTREPRHRLHLAVLDTMMRDRFPERLQEQRSMAGAFRLLQKYPMVRGDFIAFQLVTDLNYSEVVDFDEMEFVVAGPGACSGIQKCFGPGAAGREVAIIRWVAEHQQEEFARRGLRFQTLWGRALQLIDVQNVFCETNKYLRLALPEIAGTDKQTKIKQRYRPDLTPIRYWFPPKWGLNAAVERSYRRLHRHAA